MVSELYLLLRQDVMRLSQTTADSNRKCSSTWVDVAPPTLGHAWPCTNGRQKGRDSIRRAKILLDKDHCEAHGTSKSKRRIAKPCELIGPNRDLTYSRAKHTACTYAEGIPYLRPVASSSDQ